MYTNNFQIYINKIACLILLLLPKCAKLGPHHVYFSEATYEDYVLCRDQMHYQNLFSRNQK